MFHRTLLCLLPACFALLAACSEPFDFWQSRGATKPNHPYTWQEWMARETPAEPDFVPYARRKLGPPNVGAWKPEDFLPEEYLKAEHADICSLPQEERGKVRRMTSSPVRVETLGERLEYATRGFIDAQAGLGQYCLASNRRLFADPALEFTGDDALDWARRGAASGDPRAMYQLYDCMGSYAFETGNDDPRWQDQMYYWLWRAATEGLEDRALLSIRWRGGASSYEPPTPEADLVARYVWSRLWELQGVFRRGPYFLGWHYMDGQSDLTELRAKLSSEQFKTAEATVGEWLRTHADVWDRIFRRPVSPGGSVVYCPGEPGHREGFDYDGLNRELAVYGLKVSPP